MAKAMRKVRTGSVIRTKQDKTAIVEMIWKQRHRLYRKQVRRVARFYVHDPENQCRLGDVVRIEETRPISKTKHWRLLEVLERRQVADVRPIELESDVQPALATAASAVIVSDAGIGGETLPAQNENEKPVSLEPSDQPEEETVGKLGASAEDSMAAVPEVEALVADDSAEESSGNPDMEESKEERE